MEEKVLIKGEFGGKVIPVILYVLAAIAFLVLTIFDIVDSWDGILVAIGAGSAIVLAVCGILLKAIFKKRELIVTNKRVIARSAFGFRTDIPIEKITDVSMRYFNGIGCGSPSLKVMFPFCKNKIEIFDTIVSESLQRDSKYN